MCMDVHVSRLLKEELAWGIDKWLQVVSSYTTKKLKNKAVLNCMHWYVALSNVFKLMHMKLFIHHSNRKLLIGLISYKVCLCVRVNTARYARLLICFLYPWRWVFPENLKTLLYKIVILKAVHEHEHQNIIHYYIE